MTTTPLSRIFLKHVFIVSPNLEQFRVHDAGHARLGLERGRRRSKRGAVLPDIGHAGRRGLRAGHRSAGHLTHVRRPDHSTGAVFLRAR